MGRRFKRDTSVDYNRGDQDSIFGPVYEGVPNPLIPHTHPYPTRYHGYVNSVPRFFLPYRKASYEAPWQRAWGDPAVARVAAESATEWLQFPADPDPWAPQPGISGMGGCGCEASRALGVSPDGLGEPLLCASTGSTLVDALLGGAIGYIAAPNKQHAGLWAAAGAGAAALAGTLGLVAVAGGALYLRSKK